MARDAQHLPRLRPGREVHALRRRLGLVALAASILGLFVVASEFGPSDAAAAIQRTVERWGWTTQ